ncbi:DUF6984 family protein [Leeuwenhoekiella nanhaiensis]|uniref:DUF6984 domain-containing protein n=2 Tax=Leeuwenhoekiella TaxID=283735 RepID=A0A2G1VP08_9FLAO|nr:hypothetical protein [Leeuwenhoekiella nanhaiensis]PHQ28506.1 hypothetical protein CJ305_14530 [Leeuwenhoekiella nanhaiensis]
MNILEMRPIKQKEIEIIKKLCNNQFKIPELIRNLNDNHMGSISFDIENKQARQKSIAAAEYIDIDGVLVDIELSIDEEGNLFELDFWKVDFSELKEYPTFDKLKVRIPDEG